MGMYGDDSKKKLEATGDGRTKQSFKRVCDINGLVAQYKKTGQFPSVARRVPYYADVSDLGSYQESLNVVIKAREMFDALPVLVRERFRNDPGEMVSFLQDSSNLEEAVKLGLVTMRPDGSGKSEVGAGGASAPAGAGGPAGGAQGAPKAS